MMDAARGAWMRADRLLGTLAWVVICAGTLAALALPSITDITEQDLLVMAMPVFFTALFVRTALAAWRRPAQRTAMITLAIAVVAWAGGSALLNGDPNAAASFPSPGEGLFLTSYLAMAAFLVLDVRGRRGTAVTAWVEAVIVCGAAATIAGGALLAPLSSVFPQGGVPLLVAILYPLIDLALALLVVAQWALGARVWSQRTSWLVAAFLILGFADASLMLNLGSGTYQFRAFLVIVWAIGLNLLVSAGCAPRTQGRTAGRNVPTAFLMGSFLLSVAVLVTRPSGTVGLIVAAPAALTCVASAVRLAIALRESRESARELRLARTDDLTGLPNRPALMSELDKRLSSDRPIGLLVVDIDGFKEFNESLGHDAGDALIELAGQRLSDSLPSSAHVARVGGDEFSILLSEDDPLELLERAAHIRATLSAPARIDGLDLRMSGSIGVTARRPEDVRSADLLRRADIAMYDAKSSGAGAVMYDPGQDAFTRQRLELAEELRTAIDRGNLTVWYQPKVDARTYLVTGVEALVRWAHPSRGLIPPLAFLPIARRGGLMPALSEAVMRQALAESAAWRMAGLPLSVAINVAPPELLGCDLLPKIYTEMARHGTPPATVTIEVTEDTFLSDPAQARDLIADVRDHGLHASIDDYGTGFSSLSYLRDLPVSEVKLDRTFVSNVHADEPSHLIVSSTIEMSHALGLSVVAEGVESDNVMGTVAALGVDVLQGYGIAAPMPGEQIPAWVRDWHRRPVGIN